MLINVTVVHNGTTLKSMPPLYYEKSNIKCNKLQSMQESEEDPVYTETQIKKKKITNVHTERRERWKTQR